MIKQNRNLIQGHSQSLLIVLTLALSEWLIKLLYSNQNKTLTQKPFLTSIVQ